MRRSRGEPLVTPLFASITSLARRLEVGPEDDQTLEDPDKTDAILSAILRDGPLSTFCMMGRLAFDVMASDKVHLTSNDTKKVWKALERILDTPHLPLVDASAEIWARFDHLRALVRDTVPLGGNSQMVENLRSLLDMIEKVERIRPPDGSAEETGSVDTRTDSRESLRPPIPGSSRQVEASHLETGGPMAPRHFPRAPYLTGMDQFASPMWNPPRHTYLDPAVEFSTPSIPNVQPGPGAGAYPLHAPQVYPLGFSPSFISGTSGPRRAATLDTASLQAQARMQSMLTTFPAPPSHMVSHPHPLSPSNSGPLDGPPRGHVNQRQPCPCGLDRRVPNSRR
jgi:hypothetical protein